MQFISANDVHNILDYPGLIAALRGLFRDGVDVMERFSFTEPLHDGKQNNWILLPAWQFGKYQGIKLVSVYPGNETQGLATVQGVYILFDGTNGLPIAGIDGAALTLRKTAANSALAATYLARMDASTMLMVGAGALAPHLIEAHSSVRPIEQVYIWNRTAERAEKVAAQLKTKLSPRIEATTDLEVHARKADIISCATMSCEPLIEGKWLSPGAHVDLVGGYRPDMREADDEAIRKARVFVDARFTTVNDCGDICCPLVSGLLKETDITDTFQLARGERTGRQSANEITLFKSGGGGHEDLGTASYLFSKLIGSMKKNATSQVD